ncbi:hypothetical protein ACFV7Q_32430, partial [Streptomyces sp. NPDC059851]
RDSRTAMKETGKALLAWDQWGSNPSRAAGAVTFNVLTTVFTGGAGGAVAGAGKAGAVAKALSFAGKAGRAVDPMTYIFKGAGAGFSKIGDVMAGLKGMGNIEIPNINIDGAVALPDGAKMLPDGTVHLPSGAAVPEGAIKLPNDTIKLPEGTATLPPGTVKLPFDGPAKYLDGDGNYYKADGSLYQHIDEAPVEKTPDMPDGAGTPKADAPKADSPATVKAEDRVLAAVGGRGDDVIRLGSDISDPVRTVGDHTPGPRPDTTPGGHAPDNMPRNSTDNPTTNPGGPRPEPLATGGGRADTPSTGGAHPETPGATGHTDGPGGTGTGHTDGPGGTGHTDGPGGTGHTDGPSTGGHEPDTPGSGGTPDNGLPGGAVDETVPPPGDHAPTGTTPDGAVDPAPMPRGGELEQAVRDAVKGMPGATRPKPPVFERVLEVLAENPRGQQVAEILASGRFNGSENFGQVVSSLGAKKTHMAEPGIDQIVFADDLAKSGFGGDRIDFEIKNDKGGDADVRLVADDGQVFVYQLKRLNNPLDPIAEITRGKYLGQVTHSVGDHRVMLVDGQGTVAKWMADGAADKLMEIHQNGRGRFEAGKDVTFVIRLDDGTLVVPPGSKTDPKDML